MILRIQSPWRPAKIREEAEDKAREDQKYLRNLFQLNHSYGLETSPAYDENGNVEGYESRATATIEESNYSIHGSQQMEEERALNEKNRQSLSVLFKKR